MANEFYSVSMLITYASFSDGNNTINPLIPNQTFGDRYAFAGLLTGLSVEDNQ
jgi:hypothetical protein